MARDWMQVCRLEVGGVWLSTANAPSSLMLHQSGGAGIDSCRDLFFSVRAHLRSGVEGGRCRDRQWEFGQVPVRLGPNMVAKIAYAGYAAAAAVVM
jgi:hypothetical protein